MIQDTSQQRDEDKIKITQRQFAIILGYVFTDYKSQGQTIKYMLIDLGQPPQGNLLPFSAYVALSKSRGKGMIRVLPGSNETLFQTHLSENLHKDMIRISKLNKDTKLCWDSKAGKYTS